VKKVEIQVKKLPRQSSQNACLLPNDIFNDLGLSKEVSYNIHLGQLNQVSFIEPDESQNLYMYIPHKLFRAMMPYDEAVLNIWKRDKNIFLGPVVGIFEHPRVLMNIMNGTSTFKDLHRMKASLEEHCISYYFSVHDVNWDKKIVKGITYIPLLGKWEYCWFPMPDVIYDQGIFLRKELKPLAKQIRKQFRSDPNMQLINSVNGLGKWKLYEKLSKYPKVGKYFPQTIVYSSFNDVLLMLEKYGFIFLKSFHGSKSKEVLSIEQDKDIYILNFYDEDIKEVLIKDIQGLEEFVCDFIDGKEFIIQQGIRLLKFHGRKMDLRILLQKNEQGLWKSTYNASRIARGNATITSYSAGGNLAIYEEIYPYLSSKSLNISIPDSDSLVKTTIKIATYIEKEFGPFGEIGMDMAIDIYGDIWIIEGNAKPGKSIDLKVFDILGEPIKKLFIENESFEQEFNSLDNILPSIHSVFKYSRYLVIDKNNTFNKYNNKVTI
jgi:hypothetical protein